MLRWVLVSLLLVGASRLATAAPRVPRGESDRFRRLGGAETSHLIRLRRGQSGDEETRRRGPNANSAVGRSVHDSWLGGDGHLVLSEIRRLSEGLNPSRSTYGNCGDISARVIELIRRPRTQATLEPIENFARRRSQLEVIRSETTGENGKSTVETARDLLWQRDGTSVALIGTRFHEGEMNSDHAGIVTVNARGQVRVVDVQRNRVVSDARKIEHAFPSRPMYEMWGTHFYGTDITLVRLEASQ